MFRPILQFSHITVLQLLGQRLLTDATTAASGLKKPDNKSEIGGAGFSAFSFDKGLADDVLSGLLKDNGATNLSGAPTKIELDGGDEAKNQAEVNGQTKVYNPDEIYIDLEELDNMKINPVQEFNQWKGLSGEELAGEYLKKATQYLISLPTTERTPTAHFIIEVCIKTSRSFGSNATASDFTEGSRSAYAKAAVAFINSLEYNGDRHLLPEFVEKTLKENKGDFFQLCVKLVDEKFLQLKNLDDIVGLCKAVKSVLPHEPAKEKLSHQDILNKFTDSGKPVAGDPMDNAKAWPTQEKRENSMLSLPFDIPAL